MIRTLSAAVLLALAPATPAAAVIAIASSRAIPSVAAASPALPAERTATPTIDAGYGELLAAGIGLAILMFALSINRKPQRVTA